MWTFGQFARLTPEEAAAMILDGAVLGLSGFASVGEAKAVPRALEERVRMLRDEGRRIGFRYLPRSRSWATQPERTTGRSGGEGPRGSSRTAASLGRLLDSPSVGGGGQESESSAGKIDFALVEAVDLTPDGRLYLSKAVGTTPSALARADKVIVEINRSVPRRVAELHDIAAESATDPHSPLPLGHPMGRSGALFASVDPRKIVGVVETDEADPASVARSSVEAGERIVESVCELIANERLGGRLSSGLMSFQTGPGPLSDAVLSRMVELAGFPRFYVYGAVIRDSIIDCLKAGRMLGASATALMLGERTLDQVVSDMNFFVRRIVLRPFEAACHPDVVRRLHMVSVNDVDEIDLSGRGNLVRLCGGSDSTAAVETAQAARGAQLSVLMAPSTVENGRVSTIVPVATHVDHDAHPAQIVVTEQGVADLRGLGPDERARRLIDKCAHPLYRDYLHDYLCLSERSGQPRDSERCFELHRNYIETGHMLPTPNLPR